MAINIEMKNIFEIGQWISNEDGIGQVLFIRELYREPFEEPFENEEVYAYRYAIVICKMLCTFKGSTKINNRIRAYRAKYCSEVTAAEKKIVNSIKTNQIEDYRNFILYDDAIDYCNSICLKYKTEPSSNSFIQEQVEEIRKSLGQVFTFKEFNNEFKKRNISIKLEDPLSWKAEFKREEVIEIIFFNRLYKTKGKEKLFNYVKVNDRW